MTQNRSEFRHKNGSREALDKIKEIFGLDGKHGGDSKAIRKAIRFTAENSSRPLRRFKENFSMEERERIRDAIKDGVL